MADREDREEPGTDPDPERDEVEEPASTPKEASAAGSGPTPLTQQIGRAVLLLLLVLFGVFAAANAQPVEFSWVFGETRLVESAEGTTGGVPLIVLLVVSFLLGAVIGAGGVWSAGRRRRHDREERDRAR